MFSKRDRWDSSSDDETCSNSTLGEVDNTKQHNDSLTVIDSNRNKGQSKAVTTALGVSKEQGNKNNALSNKKVKNTSISNNDLSEESECIYRSHNPLLEGCRSVYDTFERIGRVSEGTYGVVWKARDTTTNEIVALKQIKFDVENSGSCGDGGMSSNREGFPIPALREISVLLALSHECIVTVKEMVVGDSYDKVFMVMEYMEFDLKEGISKFQGALPQSELKGILHQILLGTEHMHSKWLLHRDLKTSNILVHKSGRVALCDFGLARRYQDPLRHLTQLVVTLWYRSPELLFGETKYGPAIDMWSIGCIFGELILKEAILQGQGELDQIDKIFQLLGIPNDETWPSFSKLPNAAIFRWRPQRKQHDYSIYKRFPVNSPVSSNQAFLDSNGYNLLQSLLTLDPAARITAKQALEHPYFHQGVKPQTPTFFAADNDSNINQSAITTELQ